MILEIKDVPDDKAVIEEILTNAQTTISNYHSKQIRVVAPEKEAEYETAVASFKAANKIGIVEVKEEPIEDIKPTEEVIK